NPDLNEKAIAYYQSFIKGNAKHPKIADIKLALSKYLIENGDLEAAAGELREIINSRHKETAYLRLAEIHEKLAKKAEAADYYKELLTSFPTGKYRFSALKSLAELEDQLGNKENSIAFKRILINDYPQAEQEKYKNQLVAFYIERGQLAEAEKMIGNTDLVSLTNDLVLINELNLVSYDKLLQLAKLNDFKDKNLEALRYYNDYLRFSKEGSNDNEVRLAMGEIYIEQGRKDLAINHLKKISDNFANYNHVRQTLAILSFDQEDYESVITYSAPLLKTMPASDPAYITLNRNYIIARIKQSGTINFKAELAQYKKSFPNDKEGQAQLIIEYGKQERLRNNFSKSIQILDDVLDDYDDTNLADNALFYTILNYFTLNNMEKALKLVGDFFETYPNSDVTGELYNALGNTYSRLGKFDSAIEAFKSALLKTEKQDVKRVSYSNLISVYKSAGLWEAVLTTANTFIQLFPNDPSLIDVKILIGQSYAYLNRGTEGVNYLKKLKLVADADREPEIQYSIADIYYKMKNYEAAVQEYIKIPLLSKKTNLPWIPTSYYYAGRSYEYLSRNKDAIRMFEQVIARPDSDALMKKEAKKRIDDLKN
ncbi:MAG: tetratricopeptide repeat protein, partial [Calditrichaeota bacterium]|nr:tetratricopeptide repeat protein [Calditrichota bacterium]